MTTLREAAAQALEQLKINRTNFRKGPSKSICKMLAGGNDEAIADLEAALAEPPVDDPHRDHWVAIAEAAQKIAASTECGLAEAKALCAALDRLTDAALAEPVQEPVAWKDKIYETLYHQNFGNSIPLYTAPPQRKPEPNSDYERGFVDGMSEQARRSVDKAVNAMTKCKPLAEEEIARLVTNDMVKFARAIERAHGIGERS